MLLPIVGFAWKVRNLWITVLSIIAGFSVSCAQAQSPPGNGSSGEIARTTGNAGTTEPDPTIMCYAMPQQMSLFSNPDWQYVTELEAWASAEQMFMNGSRNDDVDIQVLEANKTRAEDAHKAAQVVVAQGLLSQKAYDLVGDILQDWHDDVIVSSNAVMCYDMAVATPISPDITVQLQALEEMKRKGLISAKTVEQSENAIEEHIKQYESVAVADEVSQLLMQLLGYN